MIIKYKLIRRIAFIYLIAVFFGAWGFAAGRYRIFPYEILKVYLDDLESFTAHVKKESDSKSMIVAITRATIEKVADIPYSKISRNRFPGKNGFVINDGYVDAGFLLFSGLDASTNLHSVKLIRLSNHEVVHTWHMNYDEIFSGKPEDLPYLWIEKSNANMQNPLLLDDGSLIFNLGEGPLVRIDECSNPVWVNYEHFHHSINRALNGGIWVPTVLHPEGPPMKYIYQQPKQHIRLDGIALVNLDGGIEKTFNLAAILEDNGYSGLLYGMGDNSSDKMHLNSIYEADSNGKYWNRGDLLLSMRNKSAVLIFRPSDNSVVWLKVGPWEHQHDARFLNNHTISIYGNQVDHNLEVLSGNGANEIFLYDFSTKTVLTPYTKIFGSENVMTRTEGEARILENGMAFIEETDSHRLLMLDKNKVYWEYVNVYNGEFSGAVSWSRYYYDEELANLDFSSPCRGE